MMKHLKSTKILILFFLVLICPLFLIALPLWKAAKFVRSVHPKRELLSDKKLESATLLLGHYENVFFTTSDNLQLKGWFVAPQAKQIVIFVHGGFGNRAQFLPEAAELTKRGIGVLLYDSRVSGESEGGLMTHGVREQKDLTAAIDFVRSRYSDSSYRIGVQGFSIGATTAAMVTAKDSRVQALLLNACWTSLEDEIRYKNQQYGPLQAWFALLGFRVFGIDVDEAKPIEWMDKISPRPLLMIGGDRDEDTPPDIYETVFAAARQPKQLRFIHGAGHGNYFEHGGAQYLTELGDFFAKELAPQVKTLP